MNRFEVTLEETIVIHANNENEVRAALVRDVQLAHFVSIRELEDEPEIETKTSEPEVRIVAPATKRFLVKTNFGEVIMYAQDTDQAKDLASFRLGRTGLAILGAEEIPPDKGHGPEIDIVPGLRDGQK
jgi:hypothetical protein